MSELADKKIPSNPGLVSLEDPEELTYWCRFFNLTESRLIVAVKSAGYSVKNIQAHLKQRVQKPQIEL
jgi:hypothetical protein